MSEHIVPRKVYFAIFGALLVLTAVTVLVSWVDLGPFNLAVALLIAGTKAALVGLYFMHVRYSSPLTKLIVLASLFWLVIMIGITASDYISRHWLPVPQGW